jgi:asparagine synthase (glutamine-hydrolysing)
VSAAIKIWLSGRRRWLGGHDQPGSRGGRIGRVAGVLACATPEELHRFLVSQCSEPERFVIGSREPMTVFTDPAQQARMRGFMGRMIYLDLVTYLPDDILTKVDRASMAVSLEARVPILDHRVVEFAARLPLGWKIRDHQRKWLLRQLLYKYVPRALVDRPKMGFGIPLADWLRGPLRDWAEDLLSAQRLKQGGFLQPATVRELWDAHLAGRRDGRQSLWALLMFQAWLAKWGKRTSIDKISAFEVERSHETGPRSLYI